MNEEEKEAIDDCKNFMNVGDYIGEKEYKELQIVINYIYKLQKELDKKDKVIDKMAKTIAGLQLYDFGRKEYFTLEDEGEVIEYFYKKVNE